MLKYLIKKVSEEVSKHTTIVSYDVFKNESEKYLKECKDLIRNNYEAWSVFNDYDDFYKLTDFIEKGRFKVENEAKSFRDYFNINKNLLFDQTYRKSYIQLLMVNYNLSRIEDKKDEFTFFIYKKGRVKSLLFCRNSKTGFNRLTDSFKKIERRKKKSKEYVDYFM